LPGREGVPGFPPSAFPDWSPSCLFTRGAQPFLTSLSGPLGVGVRSGTPRRCAASPSAQAGGGPRRKRGAQRPHTRALRCTGGVRGVSGACVGSAAGFPARAARRYSTCASVRFPGGDVIPAGRDCRSGLPGVRGVGIRDCMPTLLPGNLVEVARGSPGWLCFPRVLALVCACPCVCRGVVRGYFRCWRLGWPG